MQSMPTINALTAGGAQPVGTVPSSSSSKGSPGNTITAKDFMTLLVAEMKNQDPTQPSDPTQYVQQLVSVNSLEQLISINSGIASVVAKNSPTSTN